MDKTAVVYYSLDGHTHLAATRISGRLSCPAIRLRLRKEFPTSSAFLKYFRAGKSSVFHDKPALVEPDQDLNAYDTLVIATPVWAGNLSSPMRSFLAGHPFPGRRVFLVATNSGGSFEKCFATMRKLLPAASIGAEIGFVNITGDGYPSHRKALEEFCEGIQLKR